MLKFLAPSSIAMAMAFSGVAFAADGNHWNTPSMERPNVYLESQAAPYAEPRPGTVNPDGTLRVDLYSESAQLARMPVNPDSIEPEEDLNMSVYGIE